MATQGLADLLRYIRHLTSSSNGDNRSDAQLLQRFVVGRDEAAFAVFLQRHALLVFGVCQQVLRNTHDAEDAFQATFLILARKAGSIRRQASASAWLHRVALNVARMVGNRTVKQQTHEKQAALMARANSIEEVALRDWQPLLHEEVNRLPEKYRVPVVLCYLEGKTHEEAARQLGWPLGTVKGRLARARDRLRTRLARRGLALAGAGIAAALAESATAAVVPPALLGLTLRAAVSFAAGGAASGGASTAALALAKGALRTMTVTKVVHMIVLMLAVGAVGFGAALGHELGREVVPGAPAAEKKEVTPQGKADEDPPPRQLIQLTLASVRQAYRPGETVDLTLTITNNGKEEFSYLLPKLRNLQGFKTTGPDGKEVQPVRNPVEIDWPSELVNVLPGKAVTVKDDLQCINLAKVPGKEHYFRENYYPMESLGTYRLRIKLGEVTSNELVIKVLPADDFGEEVKGLRAKVAPAKEKFTVGEAIPVKYVVKNVSKEEQTIWHGGFWPNHLIVVKDADGKEPALTDFGKTLRKAFSPGGERGKNALVKVPAGGEDTAYEKYDLTWLYDLTKSGRYTVQYIYEEKQGGWEGRLPSNEAAFEFDAGEKKDRTTEKDGVRFELLVPNTAWTTPEDKVGAASPIALGLRITNGTKKAYRFNAHDTLIPEVKGPDGKTIELGVPEPAQDFRAEADCPLVEPGSSVVFLLDATFYRMPDGRVCLRCNRLSKWFVLDDAKPGRYKIRVSYRNDADQFRTSGGLMVLKDVWTGDVPTPFVDVTLVKPDPKGADDEGYAASKAVRTGDVEFQAVVQKKRLVAEPGIQRSIDLGVRFTNRGDKPMTFSVFDTMRPTLKTADGKALRVEGGRDDAARRPEPIVVAAGKSETVRWRARLESRDDGKSFCLAWTDGTGMSWYFDDVRSGKYLLSFEYDHSKNDKFWTGKATTNDVEIEVVVPEGAKRE